MRKKVLDSETERKILNAAIKIFHRKGTHGARMQQIADEADISKSMLHYYFVNKEQLFNKVFTLTMQSTFPKINSILVSDLPLLQKITVFMNTYTDILFENYHAASFILSELATNTDKVLKMMVSGAGFDITKFRQQVEEEFKKGTIRKTDFRVLLLDMLSLCVFPFVGIQVQLKRFNLTQDEFFELLEKRKVTITQMILESIKNNE